MAVCHRPASIGSWSVPVSGPVFSSCPPHYRRRAAPSGSLEMPWEAGIDDNALAPAASPPPAFQLSTVNAVARRTQPYAPNKVRRTIDGPPQSFPLQLGLRSHLAVARPLPVHWLCPLRTPATTPAKVHAGLRCDFLKKTPCASLSESANVFFFAPAINDQKAGKRHCRPNSPSRKRLSHWIGLPRPTALPLIYPSAHIGHCPRSSLPPEPATFPIARPRNLDAARLPVVARISPLPRRNKLDKTPRHPSRFSGFEKTNDLQK